MDWLPLAAAGLALVVASAALLGVAGLGGYLLLTRDRAPSAVVVNVVPDGGFLIPVPDEEEDEDENDDPPWGKNRFSDN